MSVVPASSTTLPYVDSLADHVLDNDSRELLSAKERLFCSIVGGSYKSFLKNLNAFSDVNFIFKGSSPLHEAARFGYTEMCKALLERGASINVRNVYGHTPITEALDQHHSQTAEMLIDYEKKRRELAEIKVSAPVTDEICSSAVHSDWQLFVDPHLRE